MSRAPKTIFIGWLTLVTSVLAGSTFSSFAKELGGSLSPLSILFVGESMIVLFILLSFGGIRIVEEFRRLEEKHMIPLLAVGSLATIGLILIFTGMHSTSATNAELFGRTETVFLVSLAILILHERITQLNLVGGILIVLGILVVALRGFRETISLESGDLLIILGALSFSIISIILKKYLLRVPPEFILFFRAAFALLIFFIISPFLPHSFIEEIRTLPLKLFLPLIGFGFLSRFVATLSFYEAIERLPIVTISFFTPIAMIIAIFFAHVYLGEPLLMYHFAGGGIILCGIFLTRTNGIHSTEKHAITLIKQHHSHHL